MSKSQFNQACKCLHEIFEHQVLKEPDRVAVVFENEELTFAEINYYANQVAAHLQRLGVGRDVLVGICVERSFEMIVGLLGIMITGGAYVPLDPSYPKDRLSFIIEDSHLSFLLTQEKLLLRIPETKDLITVRLESFLRDEVNEFSKKIKVTVPVTSSAYVIYTSGSTGRPKGVVIPHCGVVNRILWMQEEYKLHQDDCVLQKTPFSFDVSVWELFWSLSVGAKIVIAKPEGHKDSAYLVNLINEKQVSVTHFVPSMLQVFLKEKNIESCTSLRLVFCSGEALSTGVRDLFFSRVKAELHNLYGPTEASIDVTYYQCQPGTPKNCVPIGRPIANTQIYILNTELKCLPNGEMGEIYVGGIGLAKEYLNQPELTKERFISSPFSDDPEERLYKTGDLARYLPDGDIEYIGRTDHQIKLRGHRIELGEIEGLINEHPYVLSSVAVVDGDSQDNRHIILYVLPGEAMVPSIGELRSFLCEKVPEYMIPSRFVLLSSFPLTSNGKIDRKALPKPFQFNSLNRKLLRPSHYREVKMVRIWSQVLDCSYEQISLDDNFFDLGGNSLQAVSLFISIEQTFGKRLSVDSLLQAPTISQLLQMLVLEETVKASESLVLMRKGSSRTLIFCIHSASGYLLFLRSLVRHLDPNFTVYGLQSLGLNGSVSPLTTIEKMASYYIEEIRKLKSEHPYVLIGYSMGGVIAFEIARQLCGQNHPVSMLAMIDTLSPELENQTQLGVGHALISRLNRLAVRAYKPQLYKGDILLYRASNHLERNSLYPLLGWNNLATDGVSVHSIPGSHSGNDCVIDEPNVQFLAEAIVQEVKRRLS